jgi:4-amino-4-deoxy-L-arabinose transferase-like glycosyltransferase
LDKQFGEAGRSDAGRVVVIALSVLIADLFAASRTTLWDRDEPRFARATVEMVNSGNYLYPTFNGQLRPDKPILIYWLMSVPVKFFGPTELACRMVSAVGAAIACCCTYLIGRRLFDSKTGLLAMIILASTLMMFYIGTASTADGVLLALNMAFMTVFVYAFTDKTRWYHFAGLSIFLSLALLEKGPAGAVPAVVALLVMGFEYRGRIFSHKLLWFLVGAGIIGIAVFAAWFIPANNATQGVFFREHFGKHVAGRIAKPLEHHGGNFFLFLPYYFAAVIIGFFPWTLHIAGAISATLGKRIGSSRSRMLLIVWALTVFVGWTLVVTKLPHYVLFMWPALAIAVAATLRASMQQKLSAGDILWLERGGWFFTPVIVGGAVVLAAVAWILPVPGMKVPAAAGAAVLLITAFAAIRCHLKGRFVRSAWVSLAGLGIFAVPLFVRILPAVEQLKISPFIAEAVRTKSDPDVPVATCKYGEPTLNFYIGRYIEPLRRKEQAEEWLKAGGKGVLIIPSDRLAEIEQTNGMKPHMVIGRACGFNYSDRCRKLEVVAVRRDGGE